MKRLIPALILSLLYIALPTNAQAEPEIIVSSKKFTESVVLGDVITLLLRSAGQKTTHKSELGGTRVLWEALRNGDIHIYPEYTGTIRREILAGKKNVKDIRTELRKQGVGIAATLGFNNTYALGMREPLAAKLNIRKISDLLKHPQLKLGLTNEFMNRGDGWPGLRRHYNLPQKSVSGMDHDLAYRGLEGNNIQVMDLYSTDAEIRFYKLRVLEDDLKYFTEYSAVLLYNIKKTSPAAISRLGLLEGRIKAADMINMNSRAKVDKRPSALVASEFLKAKLNIQTTARETTALQRLRKHGLEHLYLTLISLTAAILLAVPLGVLGAEFPRTGWIMLGVAGVIQTIPSLALLVVMIPLFGIGGPPAIVALFLYSILPILRNTTTALREIPTPLRESARALGLTPTARLGRVEIPLAAPTILAGIKTSAVINVGTATLGALVGAGGFGQPILTGIRLADTSLILQGAVPAAALALLVQGAFELIERRFFRNAKGE